MKNLAVKDCVLVLSSGSGNVEITTPPSEKVKFDGKKAYFGELDISISNFSSPIITVASSGNGTGKLSPTSTKIKIEGKKAVLEGDNVQITVNGQAISGVTTIPMSEIVTVTIQKAGQEKVKGE